MIRVRRFGDVTQLAMARTIFGRPLFVACAYAIDGLLIDTGPPITQREFGRLLADLEANQVVLSHAHEDHVGGDRAVRAAGLVPFAHPLALPSLTRPPAQRLYQRILWGTQEASSASAIGDDVVTRHHHFRVLHTPGHSPDHVALYEDRLGWLFSGDLFLSPYVKVLRADENPHQTIASLRRVLALPVTTLHCASGKVIDDGRKALERKLDFMERLRDGARDRKERGIPPAAIRRELLGSENAFIAVTAGHFSKQNLIDALLRPDA